MLYRVVIVEDDPMVSLLDRTYTEKDPRFRVAQTFQDGHSALEWLTQNPTDLVVLDVYMPLFTGLELLEDRLQTQEDGLSDEEAIALLAETEQDYTGVCRKGIAALRFRFMGHTCREIAGHYGVKPNHVSAWISRAEKRLRTDKRFSSLQH